MPGENSTFTTHVDPVSPPREREVMSPPPLRLVEAPGTAPGSVTPIPCSVYRHSRSPDNANICRSGKAGKRRVSRQDDHLSLRILQFARQFHRQRFEPISARYVHAHACVVNVEAPAVDAQVPLVDPGLNPGKAEEVGK